MMRVDDDRIASPLNECREAEEIETPVLIVLRRRLIPSNDTKI